jgi:hypothetical protein
MFLILLYVLRLVTAVRIQSGPSHPSPNILHQPSYLSPSIACLTHTTSTYVPCSLYTYLEYNDTAHKTLLTWICEVLLTQLSSFPPPKTLVYCWKVGPSGFLVKMSASLTAPNIHLITSTPASFNSLINTDQTSMCLVLPPTLQILVRYTAPWLSMSRTMGSLTLSPSDSSTFFIWSMS